MNSSGNNSGYFFFQELFCLGVAFVLGATAMISVLFIMWRITAWLRGCCLKKAGRADLQRKVDRTDQRSSQQMADLGMSFARRRQEEHYSADLGVGLDNIVLQPSPQGSTILVRRVSSAPGELKGAGKGQEGERASLLNGEMRGDDLPAPP